MINQIYSEEMRTSKKLVIKFQKKPGMRDSQLIMQHLAESVARDSQKLEPTKNPLLSLEERGRQKSVNLFDDRPLAQSNYFVDRVTFGNTSQDRFQSSCSLQQSSISQSQLFTIPNKVNELLQHYPDYVKILADDIANQKRKITVDCDRLKNMIIDAINIKEEQLHHQLDQVLTNYEQNYETLQKRINEFKQTFLQVPTALNRSIPVNISSIAIYHYDENAHFIKNEKCLIKQRLSNIETELMKRTLIFMAEDMDTQITHKPGYRHTETIQLLYDQIQKELIDGLESGLQKLDQLLEVQPQYNYDNIILLPKVDTVIAPNHQNCIGGERDLQELESLKQLIQNKLKSQKFNMNTSLGLGQCMKNFGLKLEYKYPAPMLSLLAISNKQVATGARNGIVQVWDLDKKQVMYSFQTKQPVTCMRVFKGFSGDFNVTSRANVLGLDLKEQCYIITGNVDIKIWDVKNGAQIKQLKGQGGVVTSMLCLLDQHTIVSGWDDGKVIFWNAYSGMAMKRLQDHTDSVNSLALTKEGRLITASSDKNHKSIQDKYLVMHQKELH